MLGLGFYADWVCIPVLFQAGLVCYLHLCFFCGDIDGDFFISCGYGDIVIYGFGGCNKEISMNQFKILKIPVF